jgi:transcriptional regulator with XRE-family HTH domain
MPPSVPINPRESLKAQLAVTLRALRTLRSLSQDQLAKELYATRETIAAYESRRNAPDEAFCAKLDEFFETGELFQGLWFHGQREHLKQWQEALLAHEQEASQIRTYELSNIPGLLQTEGYMRAQVNERSEGSEERLAKRIARREILERRGDSPYLWVVLDEGVIRRSVGATTEVMKEQLQHLLNMAQLPRVTIQVVQECQSGWYAGLNGALLTLTKPDGKVVGYVEAQFGGRLIEDSVEVTKIVVRFDQIRAKALSEGASLALIGRTLETMRDDPVAEEQLQPG